MAVFLSCRPSSAPQQVRRPRASRRPLSISLGDVPGHQVGRQSGFETRPSAILAADVAEESRRRRRPAGGSPTFLQVPLDVWGWASLGQGLGAPADRPSCASEEAQLGDPAAEQPSPWLRFGAPRPSRSVCTPDFGPLGVTSAQGFEIDPRPALSRRWRMAVSAGPGTWASAGVVCFHDARVLPLPSV